MAFILPLVRRAPVVVKERELLSSDTLDRMLAAVVAALSSDRVADWIEGRSGPWIYVIAVVLTFAETGTLFFLVPGEVGLLVAGATAGAGRLNLALLVVLACAAAVAGDATGFWIGKRYGRRLQETRLGRRIGPENWLRAESMIKRRRGLIIVIGRWIGFLRAIMPATAGLSGMSYREFAPYDIAGAVSWAAVCVIGGYKLGENWKSLADNLGKVGIVLGAFALVLIGVFFVKRRMARTPSA